MKAILKNYWSSLGIPIIIAFLFIFFSIISTNFATADNIRNIMRQASMLMLASFGQTFAVISGGLDISVGSIVALASVVTAIGILKGGILLGCLAGCVCGALLGATSGFFIAWFRVNPIIATIGMMSLARGLAFFLTDGIPITGLPNGFDWIGSGYLWFIPVPVVIALLILGLLYFLLSETVFGRNTFAFGGNEESARLAGINVKLYKLLAYMASGLLAGIAAIVISSRANSGQATLGYGLTLESIASVVIGGTRLFSGEGSVTRAFMGAIVITILGTGMDLAGISPYIRQITLGVIIVIAVMLSKIRSRKGGY